MRRTGLFLLLTIALAGAAGCRTGQPHAGPGAEARRESASVFSLTESPSAEELEATRVRVRLMQGPRIRFLAEQFDFGEVESGEEVAQVFACMNDGDAPLVLERVVSGCGRERTVNEEVAPGESGFLRLSFPTEGLQGPVTKVVVVETNDPVRKEVGIVFRGVVLADVLLKPVFLNWGNLTRGQPADPIRLSVELRQGKGLRIQEVRSESESVEVTTESEDGRGGIYRLDLRQRLPTGRFTGTITIRTNSLQTPEVQVPFYALIEGDVPADDPPVSRLEDQTPAS